MVYTIRMKCVFTKILFVIGVALVPFMAGASQDIDHIVGAPPIEGYETTAVCDDPDSLAIQEEIEAEAQRQLDTLGVSDWTFRVDYATCVAGDGSMFFDVIVYPALEEYTDIHYQFSVSGVVFEDGAVDKFFHIAKAVQDTDIASLVDLVLAAEAEPRVRAFMDYFPDAVATVSVYAPQQLTYMAGSEPGVGGGIELYSMNFGINDGFSIVSYYSIPTNLAGHEAFTELVTIPEAINAYHQGSPQCDRVISFTYGVEESTRMESDPMPRVVYDEVSLNAFPVPSLGNVYYWNV